MPACVSAGLAVVFTPAAVCQNSGEGRGGWIEVIDFANSSICDQRSCILATSWKCCHAMEQGRFYRQSSRQQGLLTEDPPTRWKMGQERELSLEFNFRLRLQTHLENNPQCLTVRRLQGF